MPDIAKGKRAPLVGELSTHTTSRLNELSDRSTGLPLMKFCGAEVLGRTQISGAVYAAALSPSGKHVACVAEEVDPLGHLGAKTALSLFEVSKKNGKLSIAKVFVDYFEEADRGRGLTPRDKNRALQFSRDGTILGFGGTLVRPLPEAGYSVQGCLRLYAIDRSSYVERVAEFSFADRNVSEFCFGSSSRDLFVATELQPGNADPLGLDSETPYASDRYLLHEVSSGAAGNRERVLAQGGIPKCGGFKHLAFDLERGRLLVLETSGFKGLQEIHELRVFDPAGESLERRTALASLEDIRFFGREEEFRKIWMAGERFLSVIDESSGRERSYRLPAESPGKCPTASMVGDSIFVRGALAGAQSALQLHQLDPVTEDAGKVAAHFQGVERTEIGGRSVELGGWCYGGASNLLVVSVVERTGWDSSAQETSLVSPSGIIVLQSELSPSSSPGRGVMSTIFFFAP